MQRVVKWLNALAASCLASFPGPSFSFKSDGEKPVFHRQKNWDRGYKLPTSSSRPRHCSNIRVKGRRPRAPSSRTGFDLSHLSAMGRRKLMFDPRKKLPSSIHSVLIPPCHSGLLSSWKQLSVPQNKKQLPSGLFSRQKV